MSIFSQKLEYFYICSSLCAHLTVTETQILLSPKANIAFVWVKLPGAPRSVPVLMPTRSRLNQHMQGDLAVGAVPGSQQLFGPGAGQDCHSVDKLWSPKWCSYIQAPFWEQFLAWVGISWLAAGWSWPTVWPQVQLKCRCQEGFPRGGVASEIWVTLKSEIMPKDKGDT